MGTRQYHVDVELLRKFDKPGPRYTSYPTAVEFAEDVGESTYRMKLSEANGQGEDAPLSLYLHLPFCERRCTYCGCHVVITRKRAVATKYLDYVKRELSVVAESLSDRRLVAQMHLGGGTPTYYTPEELSGLFQHVEKSFRFLQSAEIAIEVDPHVTTSDHLDTLAALGFNRLSMGVQDFTPEVQEAVNRGQTFGQTRDIMEYARTVGFSEGVNLDLIYGLPLQTVETFDRNLTQVLELRPDRVAVYSFAYVPWIRAHQRTIDERQLPSPEEKLELYLTAMRRFLDAGYEPIGMDHFALPGDELAVAARERRLHRNFMGYTVKPASDMIAFGVSGIGDVQHGYFQNEKKLSKYYESLDAGRLPIQRGYQLDQDDVVRRHVITQLMCNFHVDKAAMAERYGVDFDAYFSSSLKKLNELRQAGFVRLDDNGVTVTDAGRLFVRNVCMAFDRYLEAKEDDKPVFSRTV